MTKTDASMIMIKTQEGRRMNKRRRKTSLTKYLPVTLLQGLKKGCSRFTCERELEIEQLQYFDPYCYERHVVSFLFSWCSTRGLGPTAGCWLSLLHLISIFSGPQTPSGYPRAPSVGCGFPYHTSSPTVWNSTGNCSGSSNSTELYNRSTPTRSLKSNV